MSLDETPIDCWRVKCLITGTNEEIEQQRLDYLEKYPYMCYGTRQVSKTEAGLVMQRFRTIKICIEACTHKPVPRSNDNKKEEEGKDHTIFQTNVT